MNTPTRKIFIHFWRSIAWLLIISILLFLPGDNFKENTLFYIPGLDKVVHFSLFLILEWILLFDFSKGQVNPDKLFLLIISLSALGYAVLTEIIQRYIIVDRNGDINDLMVDMAGIFTGALTYRLVFTFINQLFHRKS